MGRLRRIAGRIQDLGHGIQEANGGMGLAANGPHSLRLKGYV
jgi:hypothetical protein